MVSQAHFILIVTVLFLSLDIFSPHTVSADRRLVDLVCHNPTIQDHDKCLKTFSTPQGIAAKNVKQLVEIAMKEGMKSGQKTLNLIREMEKKPNNRMVEAALQVCERSHKYSVDEFKMVAPELNEDAMSANYDIALINPEIKNCVNALKVAKLNVPELVKGNSDVDYYALLGFEITLHM